MLVTGIYKLLRNYKDVITKVGGKYNDEKSRPIYCCLQDERNKNIFWAIPVSSMANRSSKQVERMEMYCNFPKGDIRSCYYHIGLLNNKKAIFKISNALPVTEKYIAKYVSKGKHLILRDNRVTSELERKLRRVLVEENSKPNKFEQRITDIYNYLAQEDSKKNRS